MRVIKNVVLKKKNPKQDYTYQNKPSTFENFSVHKSRRTLSSSNLQYFQIYESSNISPKVLSTTSKLKSDHISGFSYSNFWSLRFSFFMVEWTWLRLNFFPLIERYLFLFNHSTNWPKVFPFSLCSLIVWYKKNWYSECFGTLKGGRQWVMLKQKNISCRKLPTTPHKHSVE